MKKYLVLCMLLFVSIILPSFVAAQDDELFGYHALTLGLSISNTFQVKPTSSDYYIDYVYAELSWFPRDDYRQKVESITTEPRADFKDHFIFEWNQPAATSFSFEENSRLQAKNEFMPVTKKISFPLKNLDSDYASYVEPRKIIDINDKIRQQASELVQGEDDLYKAVFKVAEWVERNVEYNLSTMTAEATQTASWVMDNRQGVCDEITSLFISMCRSLGIPARFVTGISYSNINQQNGGWGPHGWAEVYFPGYGWVPFDVTYKEYGYVDATHIMLKTTYDSKETSINYGTKSRNTEIEPAPLDFDVGIISKDYKLKPMLALELEAAEPETDFGSYNLAIVKVKNPSNRYTTTRLSIAQVSELDFMDDHSVDVILAPYEEKKLYWLLRVSPDLRKRYIYTFPLSVIASGGEEAEASFRSSDRWRIYSEDYMRMLIPASPKEEKPYSKEVLINCSLSNDKIYLNESVNISCTIDNSGEAILRALSLCLDDQCSTTKIPAGEQASFTFNKGFQTMGVKILVFKAENDLIEKAYFAVIEIQDRPLLEIADLDYPKTISFSDYSEISFWVKKKSNSRPKNVEVKIEHKMIKEEWSVPLIESDYNFKVKIRGSNFNLDKNDFKITVTYEDEQNNQYKLEENFAITLNKPTFFQRITIWFNQLDHKISDFINKI
jgi:transglutaminase-like putative cysteine protease